MWDLTDVEVKQTPERELLPEGNYDVAITKAEHGKTMAGNAIIKLEFTITDGDYVRRKVWHNVALEHSNPTVVNIAKKQVKSILLASGQKADSFSGDPETFLGLEMQLNVKHDAYNGSTKPKFNYVTPLKVKKPSSDLPF